MISVMRKLTIGALAMAIVMTVVSAYIRLSDSGIGCEPWPNCFGASVELDSTPGIVISEVESHRGLRVFHRLIASVFGVVAIVLFIVAMWYRKRIAASVFAPGAVLFLTIVLALVGMRTPDLVHPVIATINLSGGILLAAVLYHYLLQLGAIEGRGITMRGGLSLSMALVLFVCIVSGAWVSANFAATGCDSMFSCAAGGDLSVAFSTERTLVVAEGDLVRDGQAGLIMMTHHMLSALVALLVFALGVWQLIGRRAEGVVYLVLLGCLMLPAVIPIAGVLAANLHNLFSLLLLLMLVHHYHRGEETT